MIELKDSEGKYTFKVGPDDWRVSILRYGDPWVVISTGTKALISILCELEELRKEKDRVMRGKVCKNCGRTLDDAAGGACDALAGPEHEWVGEGEAMKAVNMACANCGHPPEAHHAGTGQCYDCPAEARCPAWLPGSSEAEEVNYDDSNNPKADRNHWLRRVSR